MGCAVPEAVHETHEGQARWRSAGHGATYGRHAQSSPVGLPRAVRVLRVCRALMSCVSPARCNVVGVRRAHYRRACPPRAVSWSVSTARCNVVGVRARSNFLRVRRAGWLWGASAAL